MAEYNDHATQRAYESGIKDAFDELFPDEPSAEDREWFDSEQPWRDHARPHRHTFHKNLLFDGCTDPEFPYICVTCGLRARYLEPDYTREEIDQMQREMVGDAMDEQWNTGR